MLQPFLTPFLRIIGIQPKQFWLLLHLFQQLADRREILNQLGRDGVTLKTAAWMYFVLFAIGGLLFAAGGQPPVARYLPAFLFLTAFILLGILLAETGNSLVNATEGLVLAHQPINGATYTAAKLTHLIRVLLYFVPGLNAAPAVAGLLLPDAGWFYPLQHMAAAFAVGLLVALVCCSIYGWLIRFVPPSRLKAAGQLAEVTPMLGLVLFPRLRVAIAGFRLDDWLWRDPVTRRYWLIALGLCAAVFVLLGLRSLSADFLVRVSAVVHAGSSKKRTPRKSWISSLIARYCGGPSSRGGFEYLSRMMIRDYQFRRGLLPLLPAMVIPVALAVVRGWGVSPFSGEFTPVHLIPHVFGFLMFWICVLLPFGSHYQGAWVFLLAPSGALRGFASGVFAMLWLRLILIPHIFLFMLLVWPWGPADAGLFVAFSFAVASFYLSLTIRKIDGVPFGKQPQAARTAFMLPLMMAGGLAITLAVAGQHFLLFRSAVSVSAATILIAAASYLLTKSALQSFEVAIRFHLGLLSQPSAPFSQEIDL